MPRPARDPFIIFEDKKQGGFKGKVKLPNGRYAWKRGQTRSECAQRLQTALELESKGVDRKAAKGLTVTDACDALIALKRRDWQPTTFQATETSMRLYVRPSLGDVELLKLRPRDFQQWADTLGKNGAKPRAIVQAAQVLAQALRLMYAEGLIPDNLGEKVLPQIPKAPKRRRSHEPDPARIRAILRQATLNPRHYAFVLLLMSGLRRGEAIGLQWRDIDWQKKRLVIRRRVNRLSRTSHGEQGGLLVREGAKSDAGERSIPLYEVLEQALRRLRSTVHEEWYVRRKRGADVPEQDPSEGDHFVLCTSAASGWKMWDPDNTGRLFERIRDAAGIGKEHTPHGMRHDFAGLLGELEVPLHVAMALLGHSQSMMTVYYQHSSDGAKRQAMTRFNSFLTEVVSEADPNAPAPTKIVPLRRRKGRLAV